MSFMSKLPGFRTGKPWKKVLASLFYSGTGLLCIIALLTGEFDIFFFFLGLAGLVAGGIGLLTTTPKKKPLKVYAVALVFSLTLLILGSTLMPPLEDELDDNGEPVPAAEEHTSAEQEKEASHPEDEYSEDKGPAKQDRHVPPKPEDVETPEDTDKANAKNDTEAKERAPPTDAPLEVHFIDVGHGDSILILSGCEKAALIDGGDQGAGSRVVNYLHDQGVDRLDLLIATHPHSDHIAGLIDVMKSFPVKEVLDPGVMHTTETFEEYLDTIEKLDIPFTEARPGMERSLGTKVELEILHPSFPSSKDLNNASIVSKLTYGDISFLFTGDAESEAEREMLQRSKDLDSTILKVAHHGSDSSSTESFLREVFPEVAVIMCGPDNPYGHPHDEVLSRLKAREVEVFRTDLHGDIVITTDGEEYNIEH